MLAQLKLTFRKLGEAVPLPNPETPTRHPRRPGITKRPSGDAKRPPLHQARRIPPGDYPQNARRSSQDQPRSPEGSSAMLRCKQLFLPNFLTFRSLLKHMVTRRQCISLLPRPEKRDRSIHKRAHCGTDTRITRIDANIAASPGYRTRGRSRRDEEVMRIRCLRSRAEDVWEVFKLFFVVTSGT